MGEADSIATRQAGTVAHGMWASKSNPMGLRMGPGKCMCHVVGRACQVAGVLEGCGVGRGDVNIPGLRPGLAET